MAHGAALHRPSPAGGGIYSPVGSGPTAGTRVREKRNREEAQASSANPSGAQMPSAPKKSSKKVQMTQEEQELLVKKRREAIESRLLRLEAKIAKDRALLQKYIVLPQTTTPSEETACVC
jgi:hypothetical protein